MVDVRPADDPLTMIAALQTQLDDLSSTMAVRVQVGSTGDIEPSLRATPKNGQLILNGQTAQRQAYPALWQWVQDNGLTPGVFGAGDGSLTFVLPDYHGRVARGIGATGNIGELLGSDTTTLSLGQMPVHGHSVTVADHATHSHSVNITTSNPGDHGHSFTTSGAGGHSAHNTGSRTFSNGTGGLIAFPVGFNDDPGTNHSHTGGVDLSGNHTHSVSGNTASGGPTTHTVGQSNAGGTTAVPTQQASFGVNWMIWT